MDPQRVFCPNWECPARGQPSRGNVVIHSRKEARYKCKECGRTFAASRGTAFYRLRSEWEQVVLVLTLLAHGCPVAAIVVAFGLDERTVAAWQRRGGQHLQGVHQHLVVQGRAHGQVQADEICVKRQGGRRLWLAMALAVPSRLWLGAVTSAHRDEALLTGLMQVVRACCQVGALLLCVDGMPLYRRVIRRVFRERERTGGPGQPRWQSWPELVLGQVRKRRERHRVVGVTRHLVLGSQELLTRLLRLTQSSLLINTAYIERLNATFRQRLAPLARRTRCLGRSQARLLPAVYLMGAIYNFCTFHESLSLPGGPAGRHWVPRTPAMAAGITHHRWSVLELLSFRVPPPRWSPPKRPGRPSTATKRLVARWCQ